MVVVRVPRHLLLSPQQLMDRVKDNATATHIVRFLFDFGYRLRLLQGVQGYYSALWLSLASHSICARSSICHVVGILR